MPARTAEWSMSEDVSRLGLDDRRNRLRKGSREMRRSSRNRAAALRYSRALTGMLTDIGAAQKIAEELAVMAEAISTVPDLHQILSNPVFAEKRLEVVAETVRLLELSAVTGNFLTVLINRDRMLMLDEILAAFKQDISRRLGRLEIEVVTAKKLTKKQEKALLDNLAAVVNKPAENLDLNIVVDPEMWGGLKAKIGSVVYDGSLRAQLEQVADNLRKES